MLNVDSLNPIEVSLIAASSVTLISGRPVRASADGVAAPTTITNVLGLVKENYVAGVIDEISGQYGIAGSGKATVFCHGVCTVQQTTINGTSYAVYDEAQTYVVDDTLYANVSTGEITNATGLDGVGPAGITSNIRIGRVLEAPANSANGDPMKISVECL